MGNIFVIVVGPSGCGKTTLINTFLQRNKNFQKVITSTTRDIRLDEKDKIDYYFFSNKEFKKKIENNEFIEYALVHKTYYGVLKNEIISKLEKSNVIKDVDYQGYRSFKKIKEIKTIGVFIEISKQILKSRIKKRGDIDEENLKKKIRIL